MAFVVEDGSGLSTANSYLSVAGADTYHSDRGNTAWAAASEAEKQAALIKATAYLDSCYTWATGYKASSEQALSWPRAEAEDVEGWAIGSDELPLALQQATAELALRALSETLGADQTRQTRREKVGELEVEYEPGAAQGNNYPLVDGILRGLVGGFLTVPIIRA